jgi:hypothetical protein
MQPVRRSTSSRFALCKDDGPAVSALVPTLVQDMGGLCLLSGGRLELCIVVWKTRHSYLWIIDLGPCKSTTWPAVIEKAQIRDAKDTHQWQNPNAGDASHWWLSSEKTCWGIPSLETMTLIWSKMSYEGREGLQGAWFGSGGATPRLFQKEAK